ncbi:2Fe-2S iron-sulfur cluster-binding protein [Wukongibacter baidiensis]|uniref:2Fe-2S iron-sulfur cluster-binding protein n=1 Tax=Wukongibacter baidiensis TaxID=1723361 RepID=UPI003D7FC02F
MSHCVKFIKDVEIKKDKTVLDVAKEAKLKVKAPCKGKGKCGKCIVRVLEGKVSEPTKAEKKLLSEKKINKGYRLACEATVEGSVTIELENKK